MSCVGPKNEKAAYCEYDLPAMLLGRLDPNNMIERKDPNAKNYTRQVIEPIVKWLMGYKLEHCYPAECVGKEKVVDPLMFVYGNEAKGDVGAKSSILVHCKAARNRTHIALCIIFCILFGCTLDEADAALRRIRPVLYIDSANWMKTTAWAQ